MARLSVSSGDIWANVDLPDQIELGKQISFTKTSNRPDAIAIALSIYSPDIYLSPDVAGPGADRHKMTLQIGLSETSTSFSIQLSSWAEVPNKNKITFQVEAVAVTTSGIGTTANTTVYAVADQSLSPTFALDISPSSDVIQGVTPVSISIGGESLKYGASVASRSINADGRSSADTSLTITPTSSGAISVSATVRDSRGLSTTKTATFNVTAYSPPALRSFVVTRVDSNGSPDAEGTSVKFAVVWESGSGDTGDNSCRVKYRQAGQTAYTDCGEVVSGQEYVITSDVFATDFEYEFVAMVSDKHKPLEKTVILEMAFFTLDFLAGGHGIAFGAPSTQEGFDCDMHARFKKSLDVAGELWTGNHVHSYGEYRKRLGGVDYSVNPSSDIFITILGSEDQNGQIGSYFEGYYLTSGHVGSSYYLHNKDTDGTDRYGGIQMALSRGGVTTYSVSNHGNFRQAIDAPGIADKNGYPGLTSPSGDDIDYIRAPQNGFIPHSYGGVGSLGTSGWPWGNIYGVNLYRNGSLIADHVVASGGYGDDGHWSWVKYASGLAIMVVKISANLSGRNDHGWNSYYVVNDSITFQFPFAYPPEISFHYDSGNAIGYSINEGALGTGNIAGGNINIWAPYQKSITSGRQLKILAVGRWFW